MASRRLPAPSSARRRARGRSVAAAPVVAVVALVVVLLAGCGTSGRTLRDPAPGATAPPRKTSTTAATSDPAPSAPLSITSPAWPAGGEIPVEHTCDGADTSPPLTISGPPFGTVELVLEVRDADADGLLHWAVAGIPPGAASFPAGEVPPGAVQLPNAGGETAWMGPCPPPGTTHTYDVTVHALGTASGLDETSTEDDLADVVAAATSTSKITGTYTRSP